jgi:hypothetical protein
MGMAPGCDTPLSEVSLGAWISLPYLEPCGGESWDDEDGVVGAQPLPARDSVTSVREREFTVTSTSTRVCSLNARKSTRFKVGSSNTSRENATKCASQGGGGRWVCALCGHDSGAAHRTAKAKGGERKRRKVVKF